MKKLKLRLAFSPISLPLSLIFSVLLFTSNVYAVEQVDIRPLNRIVTFGQNTIGTAGTAEVLGTTANVKSCSMRANTGNTGNLYIGDSTVDSANGRILDASDPLDLDLDSTSDVYVDADTSGDGYSFICIA